MQKTLIGMAVVIAFTSVAHAELQNVTIDGSIQIRANYYKNVVRDPRGDGSESENVEQRTRLGVNAEFTDQVSSYIELDNYYLWDGNSSDLSVDIYQAYVQADEMWNTPLRVRIGRQEMPFGNSWLVGATRTAPGFFGLAFDAVRATYATDEISVDAFMAELFDNSTFSGVYGSYTGQPGMNFDAYWLWDRRSPRYVDDFNTHTFGLRGAGKVERFDFEGELAWQTADAPLDDYWAGNAEVGYTFDTPISPRVYLGAAWFEGKDTYRPTIFDRLNPFFTPVQITSFNRLYTDVPYSRLLPRNVTNVRVARGGGSIKPAEDTLVQLMVGYFQSDEAPTGFSKDLGWEAELFGVYHYTEDLRFTLGWAHFFTESGMRGRPDAIIEGDSDADYVYVETRLSF
ncbi:MAG: porin [Candidatus Hydrogenedentota bacterium]